MVSPFFCLVSTTPTRGIRRRFILAAMKRTYSFITRWQIAAPLEQVWQAIYESKRWPEWWRSVKAVREVVKGDEQGIGSIRIYTLSSPAKYNLCFSLLLTERVDHSLLKGTASGQLEGTGAWYFKEHNGISHIECHWQVATTIPWMNHLGFLLAPFFRYNHALVMRQGAKSLARKLNAQLVSC